MIEAKKNLTLILADRRLGFYEVKSLHYYTNFFEKKQHFWLTFFVHTGNGDDWERFGMPMPNYFHHTRVGYGYIIAWKIDSYFYTDKAKAFLDDVVKRFIQAIPNAQRVPYAPKIEPSGYYREGINKLQDIADALPYFKKRSISSKAVDLLNSIEREINKDLPDGKKHFVEDQLFELSRWHIYRKAYRDGIESITYDYVEFVVQNENDGFISPREPSAVKQKAKAIYEFMHEKFVIRNTGYNTWSKEQKKEYMQNYRKEHGMATRTEHMAKVNANRKRRTQARIRDLLEDMFAQERIKFKNGKLKIGVIAKELNLTPETVSKHLKEMGKR